MSTRFPKPGLAIAERLTLAADSRVLIDPKGPPWTLSVAPNTGATVTVKSTCSPASLIDPDAPEAEGGAVWHTIGVYTESVAIAFPAPMTAVLVSATNGGAVIDVAG